MSVAFVTGARVEAGMGLETAELRLLGALRESGPLDVRVVGGRGARRYARRIGARWYPARPGSSSRLAWRNTDLVHLAGLSVPPPRRGRFVATFYDLSPLSFGDEGELPAWAPETAERAERLLVPTRFVARELERELGVAPERITVFSNGPGYEVSPATVPLPDGALGLSRPYVLRSGGYTARKNVPLLLAAWPEIRRRTGATLALAGPPQPARATQLAAAPSLDGVVPLDYVPAPLLPGLVRGAAVLVSPSTYEGFGLPPLEAMAAGVPVVAVRCEAVEEVCGGAALVVENDPAALADAVSQVLEDEELRARLVGAGLERAKEFSWRRSANAVRRVYGEPSACATTSK